MYLSCFLSCSFPFSFSPLSSPAAGSFAAAASVPSASPSASPSSSSSSSSAALAAIPPSCSKCGGAATWCEVSKNGKHGLEPLCARCHSKAKSSQEVSVRSPVRKKRSATTPTRYVICCGGVDGVWGS